MNTSDKRSRAAALIASGLGITAAAREVGVDQSTIHRWRRDYPALFERTPDAPDSPEGIRRAHLIRALDAMTADGRPDHKVRLDAAKELETLDRPSPRRGGAETIYVQLDPLEKSKRVLSGELAPPEDAPPFFRSPTDEETETAHRVGIAGNDRILCLPGGSPDVLLELAGMLPTHRLTNLNAQWIYLASSDEATP